MKLICLGTSSGTPTKTRNVSAYAVLHESDKGWFLVDCGEGTQHRVMRAPVSLLNLKAILITHVHGDHCYGLPGLLASASLQGRTEPLQIVAPTGIQEMVSAVAKYTDLHLGYPIEYVVPDECSSLQFDRFALNSIELSHRVESYAYQFTETNLPKRLDTEKLAELGVPKGALWGQLQKGISVDLDSGQKIHASEVTLDSDPPRSMIISGDNDDPSLLSDAVKTADVLVHEATYTEEILIKVGAAVQHCSAMRLAKFAEESGISNLVITHFSARYSDNLDAPSNVGLLKNEAADWYSGNLIMANDLEVYELGRSKELKVLTTPGSKTSSSL